MAPKPLRIGISSCFFHADPTRPVFKGKTLLYLEQSMSLWLQSQGALTYLIPNLGPNSRVKLSDYLADLDGLVLQGGSDVCPKSYGEEPLKPEWNGDYVRDQYEIALIRAFIKAGKPVLGICRGLQVLNVALGGSLYQDIATQIPGAQNHRDWNVYDQLFHRVEIEKGSALSRLYPKLREAKVNTVHHQAIKKLGKGLAVEAWSVQPDGQRDGVIEAVRHQGPSYVAAVQWHPEFLDPKDSSLFDTRPLLKEFLLAAQKPSKKTRVTRVNRKARR